MSRTNCYSVYMQEEDPWFEHESRPGMDAWDPHPGIVYRAYPPSIDRGGGIFGRTVRCSGTANKQLGSGQTRQDGRLTDELLRALAAYRRMVSK